jgi:hypothetical protein
LPIAAAKFGFDETTPIPPISGSRSTIVPPASATILSTLFGRPLCCLNAIV